MRRKFFYLFLFLFTLPVFSGVSNILKNQIPAQVIGKAKLILKPIGRVKNKKDLYMYEILIDLRGVKTYRKDIKKSEPTVLGGYTVGILFDKKKVKFVEVRGGRTLEFRKAPFFTNRELANKRGLVKFSAVHTHSDSPTGLISVAFVKFKTEEKRALGSIKLLGDSLATSMKFFKDKKILGPLPIPFEGKGLKKKKRNLMRKHVIIQKGIKREVK